MKKTFGVSILGAESFYTPPAKKGDWIDRIKELFHRAQKVEMVTTRNYNLRGKKGEVLEVIPAGTKVNVYFQDIPRDTLIKRFEWPEDIVNLCSAPWHFVVHGDLNGAMCSSGLRPYTPSSGGGGGGGGGGGTTTEPKAEEKEDGVAPQPQKGMSMALIAGVGLILAAVIGVVYMATAKTGRMKL